MNNPSQTYNTKDLYEAAALLAKQIPLLDVERANGVCQFVFADREFCEELSKEYFFGNLQIGAMAYQQALKRLKNSIHNPMLY